MRILITGDLGFIGSHFREYYEQKGYDVEGMDIARHEYKADYGNNVLEIDEIFNNENMPAEFDLAIHCAANVGGRTKIDGNPLWVAENMAMDHAFLTWAIKHRPRRVVLFSSSAAYPVKRQTIEYVTGKHRQYRLKETDIRLDNIRSADTSYGHSKLTLELMAEWSGLNPLILRPFSGYSHTQTTDYPFTAILERVLRGDNPVEIWSDNYRDWIHVNDIVEAVDTLLERNVRGPVNLCTGRPLNFSSLATLMAEAVGVDSSYTVLDRNPGVFCRVGDPTRLNRYYKPQITVEDGIRMAIANTAGSVEK